MPTITLSWTDLALFALTAGLIGGIVIIGRSNVLPPRTNIASDPKKRTTTTTTSTKRKKNRSKKNLPSTQDPPPTTSSVIDRDNPPIQHSSSQQTLNNHPPTSLPAVSQADRNPSRNDLSAPKIDDREFPPLLAGTAKSSLTKNQAKPKRPFAERHQPPARKTVVDDMIDPDVQKPLKMARVMNIIGPEPPLSTHSISDPEDGWEKVPDSKRTRVTSNPSRPALTPSRPTNTSSTNSNSEQKLSKRQRQNAKKKEAAKAIKAAQELERLNQLTSHKREKELLRMNAQTHQTHSSSSKPGSKQTGGGMKAGFGEDGRLIWE